MNKQENNSVLNVIYETNSISAVKQFYRTCNCSARFSLLVQSSIIVNVEVHQFMKRVQFSYFP